ncbi:MAG: pyruvate, phosphate dikinase [Bacteroidales bacterium]|nr:pyruvate, phosphate dikinase [Bacteroidales bacterium]MCF8402997.1 pyruvate, phosphate dikinase [Bacteroidales bacterium]
MSNSEKDVRKFEQLKTESLERLKELSTINRTTAILKEGKSVNETLQNITHILPDGWQYPEFTTARIKYDHDEFVSNDFKTTGWKLIQEFATIDDVKGFIEVYYTKSFPAAYEGPFLKEERDLIENLANILTGYINSVKGKEALKRFGYTAKEEENEEPKELCSITSLQLLQRFLNKNNYNRDLYHDLMPFKVKEILIISNLYDAYSIEKEGRFSEHMMDEYAKLNLTSLPRVTGVSAPEEALEHLHSKHFDLVIIMVGVDKKYPVDISEKIKKSFPYIPVFLLLNNNRDVAIIKESERPIAYDRIFVWNGDPRIFFAMIKYVEDRINLENDTRIALVRYILVVEDSPVYYSRYLPILYKIVLDQTKRIIDDVSTDDLYKVLKLRARPKILLATNYEEAIEIYSKYQEYIFCLITDVKFEKNGEVNEKAGFDLVRHLRAHKMDVPVIIQSSDQNCAEEAYKLKTTFIYKDSDSLEQEIKNFIMHYLGFGNFVYRDKSGKKLVEVKSLKDFERHLKTISKESILYHAKNDHFSTWLMARGEIQAAKVLHPKKAVEFTDAEAIREYLVGTIKKFRNEKNQGKVIPYDPVAIMDQSNIVTLTEGAMGGKGRGLAFLNSLIYNLDFSQFLPDINLKTPRTAIIGTDEFEYFLDSNHLHFVKTDNIPYEEIKWRFLHARLTPTLIKRIKELLKMITKPLAVRSSGLFEDSLMQPFAGIFETFLLPNNHPDINVRLQQIMDAIKLVYASVYSDVARGYFKAVSYSLEEEKMAVVIQEVVGHKFGDFFYPHISGVAQSYNFYPFAHMKPEEGFAVAAFGLGKYVVEGEKAYRFSPKYPTTDINSPKDQIQNSQTEFYAVDLAKKDVNLLEGDIAGLIKPDIYEAEKHGTLKHCASVFDPINNTISAGLDKTGPRVINFGNILKYNYIPMAKTIEVVLEIVKEALGSPVEIEFAIDLNRDKKLKASFYLLQVKPMIGNVDDYNVDMDKIDPKSILLYSEKVMGNGLIDTIQDVIYVDRNKFDKSKTMEMVTEIETLNATMSKEGKQYILIGPGRWGTRDRWIGIPVNWPQISNAKVIVETSLEGYPLDASSGSHFFHNVTSANVGYFSIHPEKSGSYLNYDILDRQKLINETAYFRHIRFSQPLKVWMDGKKRISVITE